MNYQTETKFEKRFVNYWKMILRVMAMVMFTLMFLPLSGYSAKAETDDFLIYVEKVEEPDLYLQTTITGRIVSGKVYNGDQLNHVNFKRDGSVGNEIVDVTRVVRFNNGFREKVDYAEEGDKVEICLGSYPVSNIKYGDVLISDTSGYYTPWRGPICGKFKFENGFEYLRSYSLDKYNEYDIYLSNKVGETYCYIGGEVENTPFIYEYPEYNLHLRTVSKYHIYLEGEIFDVYRKYGNDEEKIGTFTFTDLIDSPEKAIVQHGSEIWGGYALDLSHFSTDSSDAWSIGDGGRFARIGQSTDDTLNCVYTVRYTTDYKAPSTVSFQYSACFSSDGACSFSVDGNVIFLPNDSSWNTFNCQLSAGHHVLEWKRVNDATWGNLWVKSFAIYPEQKYVLDANGGVFPKTQKSTQDVYAYYDTTDITPNSSLDQPVRNGYIFRGYRTKRDSKKGLEVKTIHWEKGKKGTTYYAVWEKVADYNLYWDLPFDGATEQEKDILSYLGIVNYKWLYPSLDGDDYCWDGEECSFYGYPTRISRSYDDNPSRDQIKYLTPDNWLVSPVIPLKEMKYALKFSVVNDENFSVYCGTSYDVSKMKKLKDFSTGGERECTVPLDGYENETIYIAFRHQVTKNKGLKNHGVEVFHVRVVSEFADVRSESDNGKDPYYYDPVYWASLNGITGGVKDGDGIARTFNPQGVCTRGQMVAFLWRIAGCPEPKKYTSYKDIKKTDYYYKAVSWAQEQGITGGYSDGTFRPGTPCSRGQAVSFLYRLAGQPKVSGTSPYSDVPKGKYYHNAVIWAEQNGITGGYADNTFRPDKQCSRSQMVSFLYRYYLM